MDGSVGLAPARSTFESVSRSVLARLRSAPFRLPLRAPFPQSQGHSFISEMPELAALGDAPPAKRSPLWVFEDGRPIGIMHTPDAEIGTKGGGHASHWQRNVFFSSSDGSDPNSNGRLYEIGYRIAQTSSAGVSLFETPYGELGLIAPDGLVVPLPTVCNVGITNKCNLRCAICGSQKYLDIEKIPRRFMDAEVFQAVGRTLFPIVNEVEISSYGEPTLHPQFGDMLATINSHDCLIKLQTNGTLLTGAVLENLLAAKGSVWISLDAVGALFEDVRAHGNWEKTDRGMRALMRGRDPNRLKVGLYPTVTRRSYPDMVNVVRYAHETGMDAVHFHRYDPIMGSFEERPSDDDMEQGRAAIADYLAEAGGTVDVIVDGVPVRDGDRGMLDPALFKRPRSAYPNYPVADGRPGAHPDCICPSPIQYVDVGLDGEMYACCRSQRTALGFTTSWDDFETAWTGSVYRALRQSLRHDSLDPTVLPDCKGCVKTYTGIG